VARHRTGLPVLSFEKEFAFADGLADIADEIALKYWRNPDTAVRSKTDGTPVTQADEEIERALRKEIIAAYPDHGILGEEEAEVSGSSGSRWILDPIDGTKNFSWGIPNFATLIAFEHNGEIACGVASAPALRERFAAIRGGGATRNGEPIHVSEIDDLSRARVGFTSISGYARHGYSEAFDRLIASSAHNRGFGDFYGHMLVAAGSLDVIVEPRLSPYDLGPLIVILEEAGGRFSDLEGVPHIYGQNALSSNGRLHEAVLAIFAA
jgi:histidinol-phosphatase